MTSGWAPALLSLAKLRFDITLSRGLRGRRGFLYCFEIARDLTGCIRAGKARHSAAWMRPRAAQVESFQWRSILRPTDQRPESEELIQTLLAVMHMSASETVLTFEIQRRDHLSRNN